MSDMVTYFNTQSGLNTLRGLLHNGDQNIPIIIVHGFFSSNKIGPYRLYFEFADYLNKKGFTVLRIDLSAMGESDGTPYQITFDTHVEDLCNSVKSLLETTNEKNVHMIAHCIGCCTALNCFERIAPYITSLSLIAPFIPAASNFKILLGEDGYSQLLNNAPIFHKGMYCDRSFITASDIINNVSLLSKAKGNSLKVFFPENDQLSPLSEEIEWANANSVDYEIIHGADHNFLEPLARQQLFSMVLKHLEALTP